MEINDKEYDYKDYSDLTERFVLTVRKYQKLTRLKQKDVGAKLGYSNPVGFSIIMRGKQRPSYRAIQELCLLSNTPLEWLLNGNYNTEQMNKEAEIIRLKAELAQANEKIELLYRVIQKLTM